MKRFKITKLANKYVILDRFKLFSCDRRKQYTNRLFKSIEEAQGFLFGKGKLQNG